MKKYTLLFVFVLLTVFGLCAENNRTALVIGNGAYTHFPVLSNPRREAIDMKNALQRLGFEVILVLDGTEDQILDAISDFEFKLHQKGGLALFHYGGHGVQVDGGNYIIPVDADIPDERRVKSRAVEVEEIIAALDASGSRTNIIILDACRDNPLPGGSRSGTRGLAVVGNQPPDSIIVYSADAGTTAQDGLFTPTLLKYMETPGLEFYDLLRQVRRDVRTASGGRQRTGDYNQLESDIYLAGMGNSPSRTPGFQAEAVKYGTIKVSVKENGTVYMDGTRMGTVIAGGTATLTNIPVGRHSIEVRYSGNTERKSITVSENSPVLAAFTYTTPVETPDISDGLTMVRGGSYTRNINSEASTVTVKNFYMSRYEVTVGDFRKFVNDTGYVTAAENVAGSFVHNGTKWENTRDASWKNPYYNQTENHPVTCINWHDAVKYCNWLSEQKGLTPAYTINGNNVSWNTGANGYRLPTEAEWEYAARGGASGNNTTYAGSDSIDSVGWIKPNSSGSPHPVGQKQANELGLYDMSGNMTEWCWDWNGDLPAGNQYNPIGPDTGTHRVVHGGNWRDSEYYSKVAVRYRFLPIFRNSYTGFRLVRNH